MAEDHDDAEKTEDPTQKRLDDAIKRGDVVKSQEVNAWFVLAAAGLVLLTFSGPMSTQLTATFRGILENSWRISADGGGLMRLPPPPRPGGPAGGGAPVPPPLRAAAGG